MITLKQKQHIVLKFFIYGKSQHAIARETGIDRKTTRKYIKVSTAHFDKEAIYNGLRDALEWPNKEML